MKETMENTRVAQQVISHLDNLAPDLMAGYTGEQREKCMQDILYHLEVLNQSVWVRSPAIFLDYIQWTRILFSGIGLPEECLKVSMKALSATYEELGDSVALEYIKEAEQSLTLPKTQIESFIPDDPAWKVLVSTFVDDLIHLRRSEAHNLVRVLYAKGTDLKDLYLKIFQPALYETGRLWHTGRITVAQEHYCTSAVQQIIAGFYPEIMKKEKIGQRMVASCVPGELHEVGVRMVADFFELSGWETIYLGSNVPTSSILHLLKIQKIPLIALSCTMSLHLNQVDTIIRMIRDDPDLKGIKIIVGGYPFRTAPDLWRKIGADTYALDAEDALRKGEEIIPC